MRDVAQWAAMGLLAGMIGVIVWSTIKRGRDDREHREFMSSHGALMASLESAKARIRIGHATEDMRMVQTALLDLHNLKQEFDGRSGISMEVDVQSHPA